LAGNNKLAARSWKELAKKFYDRKDLKFCMDALNKSLELYSEVEDLDYKEETLKQIDREIEFCNKEIFYSLFPKDANTKQISLQIKAYREELCLKPGQVSGRINSTREMIKCWEKGEELEPLENYLKLSNSLDCRVDQLINYDYPINNEPIKSKIKDIITRKGYEENDLDDAIRQSEEENNLEFLKKFLDLYYFYQHELKHKNEPQNSLDNREAKNLQNLQKGSLDNIPPNKI